MSPKFFFNPDGSINGNKINIYKHEIENLFGRNIDELNPSLSQRIKYEYYKPVNIYCHCGNYLSFSYRKGELFKTTCGNQKCVAKVRRKVKPNLSKKAPYKIFTSEQLKEYLSTLYNPNNKNQTLTALDTSQSKFIRSEAKRLGLKINQYCYHILNNLDLKIPTCVHGVNKGFNSFAQGYTNPRCCSEIAAAYREKRKQNTIEKKQNCEHNFIVVNSYNVNEKPWELICKTCNKETKAMLHNGLQLSDITCRNCFPGNKSAQEFRLIEQIKEFYKGEIIHTYKLLSTKNKTSYKSIDIFIPEFKFGIELNGIYWHKNDSKSHLAKMNSSNNEGIDLIQFTDRDIDDKESIVLSMIKNKLQLSNKIYARKCIIKEIDIKTYRDFCESNHIKGYSAAKIKLGMFYNNELVSIFSVSKSRYKENKLELIRFCSLLGTSVIGGLSKFLKYIERNLEITNLITYADLHYGNGNSYEKAGFIFLKTTPPNYFYVVGYNFESRQKYQKKKLIQMGGDPNKTEFEIMSDWGHYRYYDCGNKKFEWTI